MDKNDQDEAPEATEPEASESGELTDETLGEVSGGSLMNDIQKTIN
jgi:hypothetical protein